MDSAWLDLRLLGVMRTFIVFLATLFAVPPVFGQLPSILEHAAQREKTRKENEARRAADAEKRKTAEAERKAGVADRRSAESAAKEEAAAAKAEAEAKTPTAADDTPAAGSREGARSRSATSAAGRSRTKSNGTESQGITGATHEKYMKKVEFFRTNLAFDEVKESQIASRSAVTRSGRFTIAGKPTLDLTFHPKNGS